MSGNESNLQERVLLRVPEELFYIFMYNATLLNLTL